MGFTDVVKDVSAGIYTGLKNWDQTRRNNVYERLQYAGNNLNNAIAKRDDVQYDVDKLYRKNSKGKLVWKANIFTIMGGGLSYVDKITERPKTVTMGDVFKAWVGKHFKLDSAQKEVDRQNITYGKALNKSNKQGILSANHGRDENNLAVIGRFNIHGEEVVSEKSNPDKGHFADNKTAIADAQKADKEQLDKKLNDPNYYQTLSDLKPAVLRTKTGHILGQYDHYNALDNSIEINSRGVGFGSAFDDKFAVALDENGQINFDVGNNRDLLQRSNRDKLYALINEYPEVYGKIPEDELKNFNKYDRRRCLMEVKNGLQQHSPGGSNAYRFMGVDGMVTELDGSQHPGIVQASYAEYAQSIMQDVMDQDEKLYNHLSKPVNYYSRKFGMDSAKTASKTSSSYDSKIGQFFNEATK